MYDILVEMHIMYIAWQNIVFMGYPDNKSGLYLYFRLFGSASKIYVWIKDSSRSFSHAYLG